MRWIRILNLRTVRLLILTAILGAVVIYDYDYISQLRHGDTEPSDGRDLFRENPQNNEIKFYSPLKLVSKSQTASDRETDNESTNSASDSTSSSYVRAIEDIMSGEMTPARNIRSQSPSHINLGLILINLGQNTTELSDKFTRKVNKGRISFNFPRQETRPVFLGHF